MKIVKMIALCLALSACGGSDTEAVTPTVQPDQAPNGPLQGCVADDRCEPDKALRCRDSQGDCYLLFADQRTVAIECNASLPAQARLPCP